MGRRTAVPADERLEGVLRPISACPALDQRASDVAAANRSTVGDRRARRRGRRRIPPRSARATIASARALASVRRGVEQLERARRLSGSTKYARMWTSRPSATAESSTAGIRVIPRRLGARREPQPGPSTESWSAIARTSTPLAWASVDESLRRQACRRRPSSGRGGRPSCASADQRCMSRGSTSRRIAVRSSPLISMSAKAGMQVSSIPEGAMNPRAMAIALIAWLSAPGADGLNLGRALLANDSRERAGDGVGIGLARHLEDFHGPSLACTWCEPPCRRRLRV